MTLIAKLDQKILFFGHYINHKCKKLKPSNEIHYYLKNFTIKIIKYKKN